MIHYIQKKKRKKKKETFLSFLEVQIGFSKKILKKLSTQNTVIKMHQLLERLIFT